MPYPTCFFEVYIGVKMCILEYCHLKNKMMKYEVTGKENIELRIVADKDLAAARSKN